VPKNVFNSFALKKLAWVQKKPNSGVVHERVDGNRKGRRTQKTEEEKKKTTLCRKMNGLSLKKKQGKGSEKK